MMLLLVGATYAAYLAFDFIKVARSKRHWQIWPWLVIFALAAVLQVLNELHVAVPSPTTPITNLISGLLGLGKGETG